MEGFLSKSKIEYVWRHIRHHVIIPHEVFSKLVYAKSAGEAAGFSHSIVFILSEKPFRLQQVRQLEEMPILFPTGEENEIYSMINGNLVFHHDILKSAFYLLSGYQEWKSELKDVLGRFPFEASVQKQLQMTGVPVVNYYFEKIIEGLQKFCEGPFKVEKRRLFENFGFLLSHDIDRVDKYTLNYILLKGKQLAGFSPRAHSRPVIMKQLLIGLWKFVNIFHKENPFWNFEYLVELEKKYTFKAAYYFLNKGKKHVDAYYSFSERRLAGLFKFLQKEGMETGLHAASESSHNPEQMLHDYNSLTAVVKDITGCRQHWLLWKHPDTAIYQLKAGIRYDTSLGFAAHEGFRNSYCYPFLLFDFENDKTIPLWEFPLTVMDITLSHYQKYDAKESIAACNSLINEVRKFGGIFVLLWHNTTLDESEFEGWTSIYLELLQGIKALAPAACTGAELLRLLERRDDAQTEKMPFI